MIRVYLGGSFDPVHLSHLQMAMSVYDTLCQATIEPVAVSLMPTKGNPFKDKPTLDEHRLAMLRLAIAGTPIGIETCELNRPLPIYTIDTVRHLRAIYPEDRLIFIMGQDSLHALPTWKQGEQILDFVNIWVYHRGGVDDTIAADQALKTTQDLEVFLQTKGLIYQDDTLIETMSSSQIRSLLKEAQTPSAQQYAAQKKLTQLMPSAVLEYIDTYRLYA